MFQGPSIFVGIYVEFPWYKFTDFEDVGPWLFWTRSSYCWTNNVAMLGLMPCLASVQNICIFAEPMSPLVWIHGHDLWGCPGKITQQKMIQIYHLIEDYF